MAILSKCPWRNCAERDVHEVCALEMTSIPVPSFIMEVRTLQYTSVAFGNASGFIKMSFSFYARIPISHIPVLFVLHGREDKGLGVGFEYLVCAGNSAADGDYNMVAHFPTRGGSATANNKIGPAARHDGFAGL